MKKRELCYSICFRLPGRFVDFGFLIVEIADNEIKNMEGMLTSSYIKVIKEDNATVLTIFAFDEHKTYNKVIDEMYLPIYLEFEGDEIGETYQLITIETINEKFIEKKKEIEDFLSAR